MTKLWVALYIGGFALVKYVHERNAGAAVAREDGRRIVGPGFRS